MIYRGIIVLVACLLFAGCTHNLEIKNLNDYKSLSTNPLEKKVSIGIIPSTSDIHCNKLIKGIATELGKYSPNVYLPYSEASSKPVDVKVKLSLRSKYKGSGWNFLINFPGFLIFTPAWHGYNYSNKYDFDILVVNAHTNQTIDSFGIPVDLKIRHADMSRTWTEISWLEFGITAFISGFVFIGYDDDVTDLVADAVQTPLGDYIAQEIVARINNAGDIRSAPGQDAQQPSAEDNKAGKAYGTGWVVSPNLIATNYHIVDSKKNYRFVISDGQKFEVSLVAKDKYNDIALLRPVGQIKLPAAIPLATSTGRVGSNVFTIGYPHPDIMGAKEKLTDGIISACSGLQDDPRHYQTTVSLQAGNSGGPLLNFKGEVVGITNAKLNAAAVYDATGDIPQGVNYAVKIEYLKVLMNSMGENFISSNATSEARLDDLFAKIAPSIGIIEAE